MRSLMSGVLLFVASAARADSFASLNAGDPVSVQFGSYLAADARYSVSPFGLSVNWPTGAQHFTWTYSAAVFQAAFGGKLEIQSLSFFAAPICCSSNQYSLFLSTIGQNPQPFGVFIGGNHQCKLPQIETTCAPFCGAVSETCHPPGYRVGGAYLYDPALGDLRVDFVQTADYGSGEQWFIEQGTGRAVTRFDAIIAAAEPSTVLLLGAGLLVLMAYRRTLSPRTHPKSV